MEGPTVSKQAGIKDPTVWTSHQTAQVESKAPLTNPRCAQVEDTAGRPKPVQSNPFAPENSPARTAAASALRSVSRTLFGTTKAEILSGAKAAIEAGESSRAIAGRLACAQEDFQASQREIGRTIGQSASWVNRLLKWRQSGYKQRSPFGPTTRAERTARGKGGNNDEHKLAEQPKDNGTIKSVRHSASAYQTASLTPIQCASAHSEVPPDGAAVMRGADGITGETTQAGGGGQSFDKNAGLGKKLSPERMRVVIEALRERSHPLSRSHQSGDSPKDTRILAEMQRGRSRRL